MLPADSESGDGNSGRWSWGEGAKQRTMLSARCKHAMWEHAREEDTDEMWNTCIFFTANWDLRVE
eukprot:3064473-Alexandrium_andersonii.AAC.1